MDATQVKDTILDVYAIGLLPTGLVAMLWMTDTINHQHIIVTLIIAYLAYGLANRKMPAFYANMVFLIIVSGVVIKAVGFGFLPCAICFYVLCVFYSLRDRFIVH